MFEHRFRYRFMTDDFSGSLISHNAILKGIKCVSIGHVHCACVWTIKLMVCKHNSNRFIDVMLQCSSIIYFLFGMEITLFGLKIINHQMVARQNHQLFYCSAIRNELRHKSSARYLNLFSNIVEEQRFTSFTWSWSRRFYLRRTL